MAVKIGSLLIQLAVEHGLLKSGLSEAEKQVKKTTREIENVGKGLVDFGQKMAVAVTLPVAAIARSAVEGFIAQQKAMADVEAALKSMGNASGKTAAELGKTADQLEARSLYDAEDILKQVTAQLLTFGRISGQEFDRAQQAVVDLAARMDGDLKGAAIQIGKALNDPIRGVSALSKAGIQFSDSQKAMIRSLVETGNIAAAQQVVLKELETQFRGAAQAAADATPWRAAQVAIGQAMDAIGEAVLPAVKAVADTVKLMADEFLKLSPQMRQTIIVVAGVAAAIGPLLVVAGTLIQSTAGITAALITMGPAAAATVLGLRNIALAATGLGAIVVTLGLNFQQTTSLIYGAVAGYTTYRAVLLLATAAQKAWAVVAAASEVALLGLIRTVGGATSAKATLSGVVATLTGGLRALFVTLAANPFTVVAAAVGVLAGSMLILKENQRQARQETNNLITSLKALAAARSSEYAMKRTEAQAKLNEARDERSRIEAERDAALRRIGIDPKDYASRNLTTSQRERLKSASLGGGGLQDINGRLTETNRNILGLQSNIELAEQAYEEAGKAAEAAAAPIAQTGVAAAGAAEKIRGAADAAKAQAEAFQSLYDRLFPYQAATRKFDTELALIQKSRLSDAEKELAIARLIREAYEARTGSLGKAKTSFDDKPEGPLVDFRKQFEEMQKVLEAGVKTTQVQTVRIAQSFADMARDISSSLRNLVDGIKNGDFFDIFDAVLNIVTTLGSAGVFGKKFQGRVNSIPGNANGTAFHPGGLMMVGERGPEILQVPRGGRVIPNHELREAGAASGVVNNYYTLPSDEFWNRVDGRAANIAAPIAQATTSRAFGQFARARENSLA